MLRWTTGTLLAFVVVLAGCGSSSTTSSTPTPTPSAAAASTGGGAAGFAGTYSGVWVNTTFGSSGTVTAYASVDQTAGTATVKLTITGNVFGASAPPPIIVSGKVTAGSTLSFTGTLPTFGNCTITIAGDGKLTAHCDSIPSARVATLDVTGTWTTTGTSTLAYTVTFKDGTAPAKGTITIKKS
jgi:hypothetical protein